MSELTFKFHLNKTSDDFTCQGDDKIMLPLKKFAESQNKELKDFAFYYRSSLINDSEFTTRINESIFGNTKAKKFDIFVVLLQLEESKKKKPEEKNEIIIEKKIETKEEKKETKEEKKETKEEKKEEEKKESYYDIVCPECQTSAIIDINNDNDKADLGLKILNCENFHNLNNKAYDIYEELDLDRIPLICDVNYSLLTPPEDKLYFCSCGSRVCSECEKSHDDKGHFKIDYKNKNYFCLKHEKPEKFSSYCIDCNANICGECEKVHPSSHKIYKFNEISPTSDDINKWKDNYKKHQEQLTKFITSIKESFNNMVNTVEKNLNSYIFIEKTLIKRYDEGFKNFQLLRNLTNENIFTNSIFKKLEKHSVPDEQMEIRKKLDFLNNMYEKISRLKNGEVNLNTKNNSKGKSSIEIDYVIQEKNKNPINIYVKLFDKVFLKNNSDKISIIINDEVLEKTKYENNKVKKMGEFEPFVEKGYYNNNKKKAKKLKVIIKEEEGKCITDLSYMLNNCKDAKSVKFKNWDNSKVTSMEAMFQLTNLDSFPEELFKTPNPNLTNIKAMFCKCVDIKKIPNLDNLFYKDNNIKDIGMLFNGCINLKEINGTKWNADNITNMSYVFNRCESLEEIHLGKNFTTNNVKNMCGLFNGCTKLKKVPSAISGGNIQNVEDISIMFQGCQALTNIDIKKYNFSNVKDMSGLFSKCSGLNNSITFSKWIPNKVKEMVGMFNECKNLKKIEIGKWNLTDVSNASGMFYKCEGLKTLTNGDYLFNFTDKNNKTNIENIFDQSGIDGKENIKKAWESKKK